MCYLLFFLLVLVLYTTDTIEETVTAAEVDIEGKVPINEKSAVRQLQVKSNHAVGSGSNLTATEIFRRDLQYVRQLMPLKNAANLMFWRPQKVGSSTLLSIFMSYAFRYNLLPRRRASLNSLCRQIIRNAIRKQEVIVQKAKDDRCSGHDKSNSNISIDDNLGGINNDNAFDEQCRAAAMLFEREKRMLERLRYYITHRQQGTVEGALQVKKDDRADSLAEEVGFKMSLAHEVCFFDADVIANNLIDAFYDERNRLTNATAIADVRDENHHRRVNEVFMVRDPVARAISAYYFWGALVLKNATSLDADPELLSTSRFWFHGNESTVPPHKIAMHYAAQLPYRAGIPAPSYTWSLLATSADQAVDVLESDRILSLVLERLDESLVVMRHFLGWSLADVVVVKYRKALSSHPKASQWPLKAIDSIRRKLEIAGEYAVYNAATNKLDQRIAHLQQDGIDIEREVELLRVIRSHVSQVCSNFTYLDLYKQAMLGFGLPPHASSNKLRDVEEYYQQAGHVFSFNREILGSFDVCGSCEAHAVQKHLLPHDYNKSTVRNAPRFIDLLMESPAAALDNKEAYGKCLLIAIATQSKR